MRWAVIDEVHRSVAMPEAQRVGLVLSFQVRQAQLEHDSEPI